MKIKRFVAPDMRQALRRVREEQGPDAVILSNSRVADGVELYVAAASREIEDDATATGAWKALLDAGAKPLPSP